MVTKSGRIKEGVDMTALAKAKFFAYRLGTVLKSLRVLYTLPPERVDAFLSAYNIYDHDWEDEEALIQDMGKNYYQEIQKKIIDYYSVLNHLCAVGQVEKMYIPPAMDLKKSIIKNQELFEKKMAEDLQLKKGDRVLDVGCGRGRVAAHMATHTGAHVTGFNIDSVQLDYAKRFRDANGLKKKCTFFQNDLNKIPFDFPDETFDAIYQIQVFTYSKDREKLFKELYRILKPGGKIAFIDWVTYDPYNPKDPEHLNLMKRIKPLIGAIGTPSVQDYVEVMEKAGFKMQINDNPSIDGLQAPLIENADQFFNGVMKLVHFLVKVKILPNHFKVLFDRLTKDGKAFIEADRKRLVTTSHYFMAEKTIE